MKSAYMTVLGRWEIQELVGSGAFCRVHRGIDLQSSLPVAIKIVTLPQELPQLLHEFRIAKMLDRSRNFPKVYWHGEHQKLETSVSELLGPTLLDLHEKCSNRFSISTVREVARQLLTALAELHSCGYLHGDIKPDNVAIGLGDSAGVIYLIDFGLATQFIEDEEHIEMELDARFRGNPYWASINTLRGLNASRRDDLESLGYLLLFLLKGRLPWHHIAKKSFKVRKEKIRQKKEDTSLEDLCEDCPSAFLSYFSYVRRLKFEEAPDYAFLRDLFQQSEEEARPMQEFAFDWMTNEAAMALISSRSIVKREKTVWDDDCDAPLSESSEEEDTVEELSPSPVTTKDRRRQTIAGLPDLSRFGGVVDERRKSLSQNYDQLHEFVKSPGQLFQHSDEDLGAVANLRRKSCMGDLGRLGLLRDDSPDQTPAEELPSRKRFPAISPALRLKLRQGNT